MISVSWPTNSPLLMTTMRRVTDRWFERRRFPAFLFAGAEMPGLLNSRDLDLRRLRHPEARQVRQPRPQPTPSVGVLGAVHEPCRFTMLTVDKLDR